MHGHESAHCIPHALRTALSAAALGLACLSCGGMLEQADLEEFVDTGLTNVLVRSTTFSPGSDELRLIPSGRTITCTVAIINPKSLDVSYSLGWDIDSSLFSAFPLTKPPATDATSLSFTFELKPAAERRSIAFTLGKYVASINKTFAPETISVGCDSPPDRPARVTALVNPADNESVLAILFPVGIVNEDISKLTISWGTGGSSSSATYTKASLATPPASNPFSGKYDCYFQPDDIVPSYGYEYSVVLIDKAGQSSGALGCASVDKSFPLNYDGNGATSGSPPASVSRLQNQTTPVAEPLGAPGYLARIDYAFSAWNTKADGTGVAYDPGDTFTFPARETTLYAQWYTTGVSLSFDLRPYGIVFQAGGSSLPGSGLSVVRNTAISISCASAALRDNGTGWDWYLDGDTGSPIGASSALTYTTPNVPGQHIISCTVTYNGILYSGYFLLTVTD
jgi:hypothetical protein